jgi:DNA-binding PadR family transcriptional regulator
MQEPTFLILTALAAEPTHGYGVIRAVEQLSQGEVVLRPGTLYGALDRLTEQGLVEVDREEAVDGRLRRYYRLTESGAAALEAQGQRRRRNADAALDFGAQEFVDLDNETLEDVGGADLVFDVFGGDIGTRSAGMVRTGGTLAPVAGRRSPVAGRRSPVAGRRSARGTAGEGLAIDFVVVSDRARLDGIARRWPARGEVDHAPPVHTRAAPAR